MSVLNQSGEEQVECPLCMEPLEVDDLNFFPCTCGYQICRFCWHRIRTDENGLCPACRKAYPENPADFKPLSQEEVARLKAEKRHKDQQRKQKITENRKHLANVRVVQRNLVFVVGLPMRLADAEVLKKHEYFGKFGKIHKVVINQSTSYAGSQGPSASAYVTYHKADDALRAIQAVNNIVVDGRTIKTSLGTTKYCSHFMKNQTCPKPDCMYLHDLGDAEASFTKEEMQQGKHQEYEKKLHEQLLNAFNLTAANKDRKPTPSPPVAASSATNCHSTGQSSSTATTPVSTSNSSSTSSCSGNNQPCSKEAWPSLHMGGMVAGSGNANSAISTGNGSGSSPSGNGSISSGSSGNSSSVINSSNNGSSSSKSEGNQRRQQSNSKPSSTHKKRHTSGEENRGRKAKEKSQQSAQDDQLQQHVGPKSSHKGNNSRSHKDSSHESSHHSSASSTRSPHNSCSSTSSEAMTNGPTTETELDIRESDNETVINIGPSIKQQLSNSSRILPVNHRATLFEPDNNSFFSTNTFTKVAATTSGTAASSTTDWPINGLTLTHMSDVPPPIQTSEDWQAAFGFTNSSKLASQSQESNEIAVHSESQSSSKVENGSERVYDSRQQDLSESHLQQTQPSLVDGLGTKFIPATANLGDDYRVVMGGSSGTGHLAQKLTGFIPDEMNPAAMPPPPPGVNATQMFPTPQHSSTFVHHQDPVAIFLMNRHHQFSTQPPLIPNGLPPSQATSKFLADFHLRQQQNQKLSHLSQSVILNSANFSLGTRNGLNQIPDAAKFGVLNISDYSQQLGKVNGNNNMQNGGDGILKSEDCSEDEGFPPGFLDHQQKNRASLAGNGSNLIITSENISRDDGSSAAREVVNAQSSLNRVINDDELGFDPFHETQKALAEMMEKESMMQMMRSSSEHHQQPPLQSPQVHLQHPNPGQNHVNHLPQHFQQQFQHVNHLNHQQHPHASMFGNASKLMASYAGQAQQQQQQQQQQQHMLSQQNHRLPISVSGCAKLMDGLGLGASTGTMGPTRTRLPPPGFATAPNHMNAFGLGIPRAPSNNGSKILPFMGLGNNPNPANNGSTSPVPMNATQQGPSLYPAALQNGKSPDGFSLKEWPENLRSLLPNLNGGTPQFPGTHTSPPVPGNQNAVFASSHAALHGNTQKGGWSGVGPCTDWTTLDPAIVSSSRPHNLLPNSSGTTATGQHGATNWLRSLNTTEDWASQAPPPPGFSAMRLASSASSLLPKKQTPAVTTEMTKIEDL